MPGNEPLFSATGAAAGPSPRAAGPASAQARRPAADRRGDGVLARLLRVLLTGSAFLLFWVGGALLSWFAIQWLSFHHRRDPAGARRRCRQLVGSAFRFHLSYMNACRLIAFDPRSIACALPKTPFVLVANHPTLIDVVLLLASHPSICCVAKGALFASPLVGGLLKRCGHINAGDGSVPAGVTVVQEALNRLAGGDPVLIFPEGTRSPAGEIGAFKAGAFSIALRAQVPVVPVRILASPPGLMKGMPWYRVPRGRMRIEMTVLECLDPSQYSSNIKAMTADVRARLASESGVSG